MININDYKIHIKNFVENFPVILSTTYSLRCCIPEDFIFDYLIMDESSQIDLLSGALALSCAKNVVIVGDSKQLPQIVNTKLKDKILDNNVDICYDYFQNSVLSAIVRTYKNSIPKEVLKEHYRCHPKIIEFCNKRYYNEELIAFPNEEHLSVEKPLMIRYTAKGNHMRKITKGKCKGTFNERKLEVIRDEILKDDPEIQKCLPDEMAIITPYRLQADNIVKSIDNIEGDTIHKFQGREKSVVVFSTVIDSSFQGKRGIDFVDNANMVNVAVSRAIKQFVVVTDNKLFNEYGNDIKALINYIKYNELYSDIKESQIVSIFDLLYSEYSKKLKDLDKNLLKRSKFKSENIIDTELNKIFKEKDFVDYKYEREILIRNCIKSIEHLSEAEQKYINNRARIDFIVFDKINKKPKLFIEVDGFQYHANSPIQLEKDRLKDSIANKCKIEILRFETEGKAYSEEKIRALIKEKLGIP